MKASVAMTGEMTSAGAAVARFQEAERALFLRHGLKVSEHYVALDSPRTRVRILETGEGPAVILLPGLGMVAAFWAPLLARLHGMRLIALERPGCGLSDPFDLGGAGLRRYSINLLTSLVRALGLEKVSIIGNSIGGTMGLWFATEHPDHLDRLVLIGAPPFVLDAQAPLSMRLMSLSFIARRALSQTTAAAADDMFVRMGHRSGTVTGEMLELVMAARQLPGYTDGFVGLLQGATGVLGRRVTAPAAELAKLDCPTLLIWGRNDSHGPLRTGERMVATMPNTRLEPVDAGHLPWLDEPASCARLTRDFLTGRRLR